MADMVQRIATKALIVNDDGKILLLREANTYEEGTGVYRWHLPGGRLNIGEHFEDGLRREVMEETGLTISIGKPIFVGEWRPVIKGTPNQIVAIFFACKRKSGDVVLSEEHDTYAWLSPEDYKQYDIMDPDDKVIAAYIESAGR